MDGRSSRDLDIKKSSVTEGTMMNFHSGGKSSSVCNQLFTSFESFSNFMCVTCCQSKEVAKKLYFCSFCMKNCGHMNQKDHYFVRVEAGTRCSCAYSGACKSDNKATICADVMGVPLKKEYKCLKCKFSACMVCAEACKEGHRDWVRECKELSYFRCKAKWIQH